MRHPLAGTLPCLALAVAALTCAQPAPAAEAADGSRRWKPEPLPRDQELAAALEAGPKAIAEEAGVYVLESGGYVLARASRNGFHCLVQRSFPGTFEPQCLDREGSETTLRVILLEAELRMGGASDAEVAAGVGAAWAAGRLRAPTRPGVNYMLSKRNRVPIDDAGSTVIPYRPHVMFYAPYLTNEDLGAEPMGASPIFVVGEGTPGAYVIVPVPEDLASAGATGAADAHEHR